MPATSASASLSNRGFDTGPSAQAPTSISAALSSQDAASYRTLPAPATAPSGSGTVDSIPAPDQTAPSISTTAPIASTVPAPVQHTLRAFQKLFTHEGVYPSTNYETEVVIVDNGLPRILHRFKSMRTRKWDDDVERPEIRWSVTDYDGPWDCEVPNAWIGDVHFHRDRLNDQVNIWLCTDNTTSPAKWEFCTETWATSVLTNPPTHPADPTLILDRFGESWRPSYIVWSTYLGRAPDRVGLKDYSGD
ncbi:hypothetical protein NLJ89_g3659 [Agrocybe chaxingu]|uniref:Uncharacterized protein n=1 Tax=Agrocybe chaxingu TaxID=84603 RepID=A0A9W8K3K2_9AGAR|nr:hypothetical protein NLJ89_g3659 [Agrocybe chaxingu]